MPRLRRLVSCERRRATPRELRRLRSHQAQKVFSVLEVVLCFNFVAPGSSFTCKRGITFVAVTRDVVACSGSAIICSTLPILLRSVVQAKILNVSRPRGRQRPTLWNRRVSKLLVCMSESPARETAHHAMCQAKEALSTLGKASPQTQLRPRGPDF